MKTLFKSQELRELVDKGYSDPDTDATRLRENKKKDLKALFIIQQVMHDTIFLKNRRSCNNKRGMENFGD